MYASAQCLPELPEIDLALVHALQVAPRAPWSAIARTIGVDPATAARRWDRLVEERLAWFVVRPSAEQLAPDRDGVLLKVRCRPGTEVRVAERVAAVRGVYSVDLLAGDDDLAIVVIGRGIAAMRQMVDELVGSDPDILRTRMFFLAEVHREDGQWQLDVLTDEQKSGLERPRTGPATPPDPETLEKITQILMEDPRMSVADIGRRLDRPEPTARRLLERVLNSGALRLGCDVVASAGGAGRAVMLEVCTDDPLTAGHVIGAESRVVRCAAVVGPANLALVARFAALDENYDLELRAAAIVPGWRVADRATVVRSVKRQGRVLDDEGRVVLDPYGAA
ncbi:AsnC family transcriptional regulator [Aeromicrobium duanguangcaii]|uniref:AsnC family transcriptional regulator n=1 Tax=Aeromicrobium duanguangcaii TaxID=2968086 RepID=A0ABY5KG10_9ACTN|nr:AsnC family transcriptional regulator [Aeromicrobium duanguangcaii]MCD9154175.1 AsnC family transcriptional regulator [Aeromicrobium duanguangcaii]UUI68754.1 AsnC family transcriptional regulator [Aeromicrobium duanguangcaii]